MRFVALLPGLLAVVHQCSAAPSAIPNGEQLRPNSAIAPQAGMQSTSPLTPSTVAARNLVPPITAANAWRLWLNGAAQAVMTPEENALKIEILAINGDSTHISPFTTDLDLKADTIYTISFRAKADQPRDISIFAEDTTNKGIGLNKTFALSPEWKTVQLTFTTNQNVKPNKNTLEFWVGQKTGILWIADVTLIENVASIPPQTKSAQTKPVTAATYAQAEPEQAVKAKDATHEVGATPITDPRSLVLDFIQEAQQLAATITDVDAKANVLRDIAVAQAQAGETAAAQKNLVASQENAVKIADVMAQSVVLRDIAAHQAQIGDLANARQSFVLSRTSAEQIKDLSPKVVTLSDLAAAQDKAGDAPGAAQTVEVKRQTIQAARDAAMLNADAYQKAAALATITAALAESGDVVTAQQIAGQINGAINPSFGYQKSVALASIASAQAKVRNVAKAQETTQEIINDYQKSLAFWNISAAQAKVNDRARAMQTAAQVPDAGIKSVAYQNVAAALAQGGDVEGAKQAVGAIADGFRKALALQQIASAQAQAGNITGAQETFKLITDPELKEDALLSIAVAQAKAGDIVAARGTINQITSAWTKIATLTSIAGLLAQAIKPTQAVITPSAQKASEETISVKAGEILLSGAILSFNPATHQLVLSATQFALPNGKTGSITPAKPKTVVVTAQTFVHYQGDSQNQNAALDKVALPQTRMQAVGLDSGAGVPLSAREIVILR